VAFRPGRGRPPIVDQNDRYPRARGDSCGASTVPLTDISAVFRAVRPFLRPTRRTGPLLMRTTGLELRGGLPRPPPPTCAKRRRRWREGFSNDHHAGGAELVSLVQPAWTGPCGPQASSSALNAAQFESELTKDHILELLPQRHPLSLGNRENGVEAPSTRSALRLRQGCGPALPVARERCSAACRRGSRASYNGPPPNHLRDRGPPSAPQHPVLGAQCRITATSRRRQAEACPIETPLRIAENEVAAPPITKDERIRARRAVCASSTNIRTRIPLPTRT